MALVSEFRFFVVYKCIKGVQEMREDERFVMKVRLILCADTFCSVNIAVDRHNSLMPL